jgi:hypothetical protein
VRLQLEMATQCIRHFALVVRSASHSPVLVIFLPRIYVRIKFVARVYFNVRKLFT